MATSTIKKPATPITYLKTSDFVTERKYASYDIGANATKEVTFPNASKSGYKILKVVSFYSGGQVFTVSQVSAGDDGVTKIVVHNTAGSAYTGRQAWIDILYVRNV